MKKGLENKLEAQNRFVTKSILKGLTICQIAQKLDCSTSTVSNRIKKIFKQYNATNRSEFIINVLAEIIQKDRLLLEQKEHRLLKLEEIIYDMLQLKNDKDKLQEYIYHLKIFT